MDGYLDGQSIALRDLAASLGPAANAATAERQSRIPLTVDRAALERQIERLYRDPLNTYLPLDAIAFIAGEQVQDKSMEAELQRLRPLAYARYQQVRQLERPKR